MSATRAKASIVSAAALFMLATPAAADEYFGTYSPVCDCWHGQPYVRATYGIPPVYFYGTRALLAEPGAYAPLEVFPVDQGPSYAGPAIVSVNTGISYTPAPYIPARRWTYGVRYDDGYRWGYRGVRYGGYRWGYRGYRYGARVGWRYGVRHGARVGWRGHWGHRHHHHRHHQVRWRGAR